MIPFLVIVSVAAFLVSVSNCWDICFNISRKIDKLDDNKVSVFRHECTLGKIKDLEEKLYAMERHLGVSVTYNPQQPRYSYVKTEVTYTFKGVTE